MYTVNIPADCAELTDEAIAVWLNDHQDHSVDDAVDGLLQFGVTAYLRERTRRKVMRVEVFKAGDQE